MLSLTKIRIRFFSDFTQSNMFNRLRDTFVLELKFKQGQITVTQSLISYQNNYINGVRHKELNGVKQKIKMNNTGVPRRNNFHK